MTKWSESTKKEAKAARARNKAAMAAMFDNPEFRAREAAFIAMLEAANPGFRNEDSATIVKIIKEVRQGPTSVSGDEG